jgi:hypothetical protein
MTFMKHLVPARKTISLGLLFSMVLFALPAHASNYACTGTVTYVGVGIYGGGEVVVGGPAGLPPIVLCSLNGTYNSFTADTCKASYAILLTARTTGQAVDITFSDNLTCSTQPAWGNSGPTSAWFVAIHN